MKSFLNLIKEYFKTNKKKTTLIVGAAALLFILIVTISSSFANLTPVSSVEIFSQKTNFVNGEMGAWKVTKSAEWIEENIANINLKLESNLGVGNASSSSDYIFVIETSTKMGAIGEENLSFLYQFYNDLIQRVITQNEGNKVSLITFNSNYNIINDFTRTPDIKEVPFIYYGNTNYYQALNGINEVLSKYDKNDKKDCKVIFITASSPNEQTPNEASYIKMLRKKYPFLKVNSISCFFADSESKTPLYNISDSLSVLNAGMDKNELNKVIIEATGANNYLNFVVEDTINSQYFEVIEATSNIGNIKIDKSMENVKVIWDLKDEYSSKTIESLDIKVRLKDQYQSSEDVLMLQINVEEKITSFIRNLEEIELKEDVVSNLTPVLSANYAVIYDNNAPDSCTIRENPKTKRYNPFKTVEISEETPSCNGYIFKGWKIVDNKVEKIGSDYFIMPSHDVILKAEWAKVSIKKSIKTKNM